MAISLRKNQKIDIDFTKLTFGFGYSPNEVSNHDFNIELSAIMINSERRLISENHFVFYNNLTSPDGALTHTGDTFLVSNGECENDKSILVDLEKVNSQVQEILFVVTINDFETRKQNFGQVRNSNIRVVNNSTNEEIAKYELREDFSIETGVELGRLCRIDGKWVFEALGIGYKADLSFFLGEYFNGLIIKI